MVNFLFSLFERSDKREETRQAFLEQSGRKGLGLEPSLKEKYKVLFLLIIAYLYRKYSDLLQKKTPHSYKYIEPHYDYK